MKVQWFLIFVAFSSLGIQAFLDIGRGPLFPEIIKDLGIDTKQGGLFFSATSLSMLFGSFGASYLMRFLDSFKVLLIFMVSLIAGQFLLANVAGLSPLVVTGVLLGLGFGGMGVCQNLSISEAAPVSLHRKLYGGLHSMYALAALLAPLIITQALSAGVFWRDIAKYELVVPIVLFITYLAYSFVKAKKSKNIDQKEEDKRSAPENIAFSKKVMCAMGLAMYVVAELIVSIWLVLFLQKEKGFNTEDSGFALTLFFAFLLSGRVLMSFVEFKSSNFKLLAVSFLSSGVLLILGIAFNPWFIAISGLSMSICFPVYMSYMAEIFGDELGQVMPYCIGGMSFIVSIAHSLAGYLGDQYGLYVAMSIAVFGAFWAFGFLSLIERSFSTQKSPVS